MPTDSPTSQPRATDSLGRVGLPMSIASLAAQRWDAIVVGAGHNGLTCAAYLARAGQRVLVLEARERVGGACTLEEPWPGYRVSPCAYVAGLLHPLVLRELGLYEHGLRWTPASGGLFVPFDDGTCIQLWDDEARCVEAIRRFAPADVAGWQAMQALVQRVADRIRPPDMNDMWIGPAPTQAQIADRLGGDREALALLFEWSMADLVERFLSDERLQLAYLGQGTIGTFASPFDPGTAAIYFHHYCGRMHPEHLGSWGYIEGGMGMVSFILCDIARAAGATVAAGVPVGAIVPGQGVELADGTRIDAPVVVSNADPRATLGLLGGAADPAWRAQVLAVPQESCVVKFNAALSELPNLRARPGLWQPHHQATLNTPLSKDEWRAGYAAARAGQLPARLWCEIYLQTAYDSSVAPAGRHTMSVLAQYVPYRFAEGDWETRRDEVGRRVLEALGRFCSNIPDVVLESDVLGPPDVERRLGLTGGHIFHGECLPAYLWDRRLAARTPMAGMFLCGAGTHPGGSVIGVNGRNAALEVIGTPRA